MKKKIIIILSLMILVVSIGNLRIKVKTFKNVEDDNQTYTSLIYQVLDCYDLPEHDRYNDVMNKKNSTKKFEDLYDGLNAAEYFDYLEVYNILLQYQGFYDKGNKFIFEYGYVPEEDLNELINQNVIIGKDNVLLTNIKGIFIGDRAFNEMLNFDNLVVKGNAFSKEDYIYTGNYVNVILGYDYMDYYDLNDKITVHYWGYPLELNVIGFFEQETYFSLGHNTTLLDTYIIVPSFKIDESKEQDIWFRNMHLSNKTKGFLQVDKKSSISKALQEFESIIQDSELDYTCIPVCE